MRHIRFFVGFALIASLTLSAQNAQQPSLRWFSQSLQRVVEQVSPSVVQISAQGLGRTEEAASARVRTQRGTGTGVILDAEGYIVTNAMSSAVRLASRCSYRSERISDLRRFSPAEVG
jgi:S1-C subfamily serine protease